MTANGSSDETKDPQQEQRRFSRGLPAIDQMRRARARFKWGSPKFWLWVGILLAASLIFWWWQDRNEIQRMRAEVLDAQRRVVDELGPVWLPLRADIERWTTECAQSTDEVVAKDVLAEWDFRAMPGIYLRLASYQTQSPERIRKAAQDSLHDGFTACLLVVPNPNPLAGPACTTAKDCAVGQHCNAFDHCAKYSQPYNLRLAYKTMRLLSDEWVREVQSASDELTMRGAKISFDDVNSYEIPIAMELLSKATYFLVVVDQVAEPAAEAAAEQADAGQQRAIPAEPHKARICAWRREDKRRVLALTRDAAGELRGGIAASATYETREALQRQANSCALALEVREAMGDDRAAKVPAGKADAGAGEADGGGAGDGGSW